VEHLLGQPCFPSPKENLSHHVEPHSSCSHASLGQQTGSFIAGFDHHVFPPISASIWHLCFPSSRENVGHCFYPSIAGCVADFDVFLR